MTFSLPQLKYDPTTFRDFVSPQTFACHHEKHHAAYISNTNQLIKGSDYENKSLLEIVMTSSGPLFNNAAQAWNHEFYFNCLTPQPSAMPAQLKGLLEANFGSVDAFMEKFSAAAVNNFGSGWTWLMQTGPNKLKIFSTSNAANPMVDGFNPVLTVDVWEHAYYLDFQNRRADYVKAFLAHVDWDFVTSCLK